MADKNFKESFYTKLNQNDSLFTFYLVSQMDTAKLFTLQDKLILEKNETIELSAELPFKSYNILKDGFIEVSKKETANNLKEITIFLKKRSEKEFDVSIANANNPIVNLTCMDTLIALPLRLPGAVQ